MSALILLRLRLRKSLKFRRLLLMKKMRLSCHKLLFLTILRSMTLLSKRIRFLRA